MACFRSWFKACMRVPLVCRVPTAILHQMQGLLVFGSLGIHWISHLTDC
jgi:hypothetical protein